MNQTISRRSALRRVSAGLAGLSGLPFGHPFSLARAAGKATAFALVGDRYHNSDYIRTALGKSLGKDGGLSIDFSDEVTLLNNEHLKGYKLLIILRDGMLWPDGYGDESSNAAWVATGKPKMVSDPPVPPPAAPPKPLYWITTSEGKAVRSFVENGGGVLFFHNVTYISPHNDDFQDVLGAVTEGHPPIRTFKVKVVNPDHPITRGVKDFVVTDEQHFMKYQKDPKYLLLQSVNEDGLSYRSLGASAPAGWAYDYGKGRVCYLAPGHLVTVLWNPEYAKIQRNAVKWLLRES